MSEFYNAKHELDKDGGRLYHGDSSDMMKTFADGSVDLIVTDPPYGIHYRSNRQRVDRKKSVDGEGSVVIRDHYFNKIENDQFLSFPWMDDAYRVLKDGSAMYVFGHWSKWHMLHAATEEAGFTIKNMIVLSKSNHGMGDLKGSYAPRHELILFATKGRHELRFPQGRTDDIGNVPVKFSGSKRYHPNEKPLSWLMPAVMNSSDEGQLVVDPFMGSGTTGMVAVGMGRRFIGCDVDETYYQTSVTRVDDALRHRKIALF